MTACIVIPHNKELPLTKTEFVSVDDFEMAIGGRVEHIYLRRQSLLIYTSQSGKARHMPVNKRATALWWLLDQENTGQATIVGDVVIVGTLGRNFAADIPPEFVDLVMKARKYKVFVAVTSQASNWLEIPDKFDDYFDAALCAVKVAGLLAKPTRVLPA
jgi:hypothetical protein